MPRREPSRRAPPPPPFGPARRRSPRRNGRPGTTSGCSTSACATSASASRGATSRTGPSSCAASWRDAVLVFRPHFWLSDEWFCPDGEPGIAMPFYLAHPRLARLEMAQMREVEGGTREWCLRILRHETGHAIENAYRLRRRPRRRELFGRTSQPYPDSYSPRPYSKSFVRHLDAWYAQSHPDEDFAETFAVWLTPDSDWRRALRALARAAQARVRGQGHGADRVPPAARDFTPETRQPLLPAQDARVPLRAAARSLRDRPPTRRTTATSCGSSPGPPDYARQPAASRWLSKAARASARVSRAGPGSASTWWTAS
jgi:hypothetical protein